MSLKAFSWILLSAIAIGFILLFNYWASYQLLSTLAYAGIAAALGGLANAVIPFRFLGIRRRIVGVVILAGGVVLMVAALIWPAPMFRVGHPQTYLDDAMPEYQFWEKHSVRIHARPEQVMQAVRQSTFGDMKSLSMLLKIRSAGLRTPSQSTGALAADRRILDAFSASGYVSGGGEHEIVTCGGANVPARRPLKPRSLEECASYREPGAIKVAFNFKAGDAGQGWSVVSTETRVLATDDVTSRGMGRYWRLIVPGSGLLRRQWLAGIKRRAESEP